VVAGQNLDANNFLADFGNIGTSSNYNLGGTATVATIGNTTTNGAHTHTFTTDSEGSGQAFDILPPYYALCFIMKTYA
jgi:uroporphyrinogen-III synthase